MTLEEAAKKIYDLVDKPAVTTDETISGIAEVLMVIKEFVNSQ